MTFRRPLYSDKNKLHRSIAKFKSNLFLLTLAISLALICSQSFIISTRATFVSEPIRILTPTVASNASPSLPSGNLSVILVTPTSIVLTWPNATAAEYRIRVNGTILNTLQGNITSYYLTNLNAKATYTFLVEAGDGTGNWSPYPSLTVDLGSLSKIPLVLSVPGPEMVQAGAVLTFAVNATGPNVPNETVSITASGLPAGATFPSPSTGNPISATFAWSPTSSQGPGNYTLTFQASDTLKSPAVTRTVLIRVTKAKRLPVLSVPGPQSLSSGSLLSFAVVAADPNLPPSPVTVSAAGLPNGSSFNSTTGVFSWIASCDRALCDYVLTFTAQNQNGVVQKNVAITVNGLFSTASLQQSMTQDFFNYLPWVLLLGTMSVAVIYILRLRRVDSNKRNKLLKRAIGDGAKPDVNAKAHLFKFIQQS